MQSHEYVEAAHALANGAAEYRQDKSHEIDLALRLGEAIALLMQAGEQLGLYEGDSDGDHERDASVDVEPEPPLPQAEEEECPCSQHTARFDYDDE